MEIIAVCFQIHTKHINTLCGQNVEFVDVKADGTYSDHWVFRGFNVTRNGVAIAQVIVPTNIQIA
jgi:hypothetical protein